MSIGTAALCPGGRERGRPGGVAREHLGLDGLDVVGAVRRLVLGLLVLHGVDDLVISGSNSRARHGADDVVDLADGGVGALGAVVGVRRRERRRLAAGRARAREDEERLGDELCEGFGAVRRSWRFWRRRGEVVREFPAFPRAFRDDRRSQGAVSARRPRAVKAVVARRRLTSLNRRCRRATLKP